MKKTVLINGTEYRTSNESLIVENVLITDIVQIDAWNPRLKSNEKAILNLESVDSDILPPIILAYNEEQSDKLIVIDGNHRFSSRVNKGELTISSKIIHYTDQEEMFKDATKFNLTHGVMLTKEERYDALSKIIKFYRDNDKGIKFGNLSRELNINRRELTKIDKWIVIQDILSKEEIKYNITVAEFLYRFVEAKRSEELPSFWKEFKDLTSRDIGDTVTKYLNGEPVSIRGMAIEQVNEDTKEIADIMDSLEEEDLQNLREDICPINDNAEDFIEDTEFEDTETVVTTIREELFVGTKMIKNIILSKKPINTTDRIEVQESIVELENVLNELKVLLKV